MSEASIPLTGQVCKSKGISIGYEIQISLPTI